MTKRTITSIIPVFSLVIAAAILCSTLFVGVAGAQAMPQYGGSYGGNYGGGYGQQMAGAGGGYGPSGGAGFLSIPGLEGLQGFMPGENRLSLAVIPVSQQNGQLGFQVIGFAISSAQTGAATAYSLSQPLAGVIDPSQNTLQVDLTNLASNVKQAGYIASSQVYDSLRADPRVVVIDVDMSYQGMQGTQTIFNVNAVSIIPPDGKMQAFQMQQPTQLFIDSQSMRIYMVAFPQMVDAFNSYYGTSFSQVLPIVFTQPIPILAPVFVPFLQPFPIFFSSFISFNPFFFGDGFRPFFDRDRDFDRFHGNFPIHERNFGLNEFNEFRQGIIGERREFTGGAGIGTAIGRQGGMVTQPSNVRMPSGFANVRTPAGVGAGENLANVRVPTGAGAGESFANVRMPTGMGGGITGGESFANVRAPTGPGAGMPFAGAGIGAEMPSFGGSMGGIGGGLGGGLGGGIGGGGRR